MLHVRDPPPEGRGLPRIHRAVRILPGGVEAGKFDIPFTNTCLATISFLTKLTDETATSQGLNKLFMLCPSPDQTKAVKLPVDKIHKFMC